jgi:ribosomal protein S18 acetylase RimI-like enzyme
MIIHTQHLQQETIEALNALVDISRQKDGNKIAIYTELLMHQRSKPDSLLYYKQKQLVGFAAVFFFEHDTAEISLLIHPEYRKKGYGNALLRTLLESVQESRPVSKITFSIPHGLHKDSLTARNFQYQNSEYEMQLQLQQPLDVDFKPLEVRVATHADMETLCLIDQICFPTTHPYSVYRFETLLAREDNLIFVASFENQIIGKAHLSWDKKSARLSDIAVLPAMQNQGFGKKIIAYCLNQALKIPQTNITLSVETHNKNALNLYQHLGFNVINAIDYWECLFKYINASSQDKQTHP